MTPRLVAITDRHVAGAEATLERFAELGRLARPGSVAFQLRDPELTARERLEFGRALAAIARGTEQLFVVNDRADLAVLLQADGLHLGETGMTTDDARRLLGEHVFISRACHEPLLAGELDADALLLSPIFDSRKGLETRGVAALRTARAALADANKRTALLALGGISPPRVGPCRAEGADGVAVVGAVLRGEGPELVRALGIDR